MRTKQSTRIRIYDYDKRINRTLRIINKELSSDTIQIVTEYYNSMIAESLSKALQLKHLQTILNLSRFLGKDWSNVTKKDIDGLVAKIVTKYSDDGQETHTTHDHKKVLKIFFRWYRLGSRSKQIVGDPPETAHVIMKKVRDKIIREDLLTEDDRTRLLPT